MVEFSWNIIFKCNYRCPYCWFHDKWDDISKINRYISVEELIKYWKNIYYRYGTVEIQINGGEPFIYPNFIELVIELSKIHKIGITTNLSFDVDYFIKKLRGSNNYNIGLGASFHPLFVDYDNFIKKAIPLYKLGILKNILYLAWPPQIKYIPLYKKKFEKEGLNFTVITFWGNYNGIDYPQGYTAEEREIINSALGVRSESGEKFQLKPVKTKGRLCRAGQIYALIHPDGGVFRCGGGNWKEQHPPFANFFDEDFKLLDAPLPCESEECPCNEWSFLLVNPI